MNKIEVKWLKNENTPDQIYNSGLQYCFLSDAMEQCHSFVYCKDFLQDAVFAHLHQVKKSIYRFSYDPSVKPPLCMQRTRIALANKSDSSFRERMPGMLDFVNQFCDKLNLKHTQVFEAVEVPKRYNKCGIFITDGSAMWMNSPPLLSMYSLFLRCGCAHKKGDDCLETIDNIISGKIEGYQEEDRSQLRSAKSGIDKILKIGYRPFFYIETKKNYPVDTDIHTMHDGSGIMAFSTGGSKKICPYWHRESLEKKLKVKN